MSTIDMVGIGAALTVVVAMVVWFRKVKAGRLSKVRFHYFSVMVAGAGLGVYAIVAGAGWMGMVPAVFAVAMGLVFPALRLGSAQGDIKPAIVVGDKIIDFTALDAAGRDFDLASLRGRPFLLKFFRGHW
ncbi:MAG: hypothetical protein GY866_07560 [Proteobacteria bacterium]|nr:hypothetical protein [Pseudomonadota bacterium]